MCAHIRHVLEQGVWQKVNRKYNLEAIWLGYVRNQIVSLIRGAIKTFDLWLA